MLMSLYIFFFLFFKYVFTLYNMSFRVLYRTADISALVYRTTQIYISAIRYTNVNGIVSLYVFAYSSYPLLFVSMFLLLYPKSDCRVTQFFFYFLFFLLQGFPHQYKTFFCYITCTFKRTRVKK